MAVTLKWVVGTAFLLGGLMISFSGCSSSPQLMHEGTSYKVPGSDTDKVDDAQYFYKTTGRSPDEADAKSTGEYDPNDKPQYSAPTAAKKE
jgi:hypothetical protein